MSVYDVHFSNKVSPKYEINGWARISAQDYWDAEQIFKNQNPEFSDSIKYTEYVRD